MIAQFATNHPFLFIACVMSLILFGLSLFIVWCDRKFFIYDYDKELEIQRRSIKDIEVR